MPDYCIYWLIYNLSEWLAEFLIKFVNDRPPAADGHLTIQLDSAELLLLDAILSQLSQF